MRELEFIDWICSQPEWDPTVVPVGPGDDCAVVAVGDERMMVTNDQLLDGVHFRLEECGPQAVGRKAMARAISDIAAMAGLPLAAVASVALPRGFSQDDAQAMYRGRRTVSDEFNCPVVGGDTGSWDGRLAISITVFGRPEGIEPVLRNGAQIGDAICVTGALGGSWRSTRHLTFTPRIREARQLASQFQLHAMIDISDGLALDLSRICKASGTGAVIQENCVPIHEDAHLADIAPIEAALGDGEDYELLFTLPADQAERLVETQPLDAPVTRIGTIVEGNELTRTDANGKSSPLQPSGWEHKT